MSWARKAGKQHSFHHMTSMVLGRTAVAVIIKYPAVSKPIHMKLSTLSGPTQLLGSHSDGSWRCGEKAASVGSSSLSL